MKVFSEAGIHATNLIFITSCGSDRAMIESSERSRIYKWYLQKSVAGLDIVQFNLCIYQIASLRVGQKVSNPQVEMFCYCD
jgi:hypothetical protein